MTRERFTDDRSPRIHYQDRGQGPPVLVLNGWSASGLIWPDVWLERLERSLRLLLVDNRGTGHSGRADLPFTMRDLADDAVAVLDDAGLPAAHVFGLSMGGMIAQTVAVEHPDRVRGLVLCATTPGMRVGVPSPGETITKLISPARGSSRREIIGRVWPLIAAPGFAERHPDRVDALIDKVAARPTALAVILLQMQAIMGFAYEREAIGGIRAPTLVIHGDADPLIPVENGRILADVIPGARLEILPGVGHIVADEAPERSAELVEEFLLEVSGA